MNPPKLIKIRRGNNPYQPANGKKQPKTVTPVPKAFFLKAEKPGNNFSPINWVVLAMPNNDPTIKKIDNNPAGVINKAIPVLSAKKPKTSFFDPIC